MKARNLVKNGRGRGASHSVTPMKASLQKVPSALNAYWTAQWHRYRIGLLHGDVRGGSGNRRPLICWVLESRCENLLWGNLEAVREWKRGIETTASRGVRSAQISLA